ncbi:MULTISPECIES: RNA 2',3'-cyclic phosphodiesterase [unclassified Streptomyces]|uniref:RNA 2',3'-cyclic phosphodiesterase n=1 Tax=unclassified Streptomyces TaxID=2593676 RepID=UPI000DBA1853|nr:MULTISPECIES: RNA 2',3'-cyclic phosphodiesterase [unclassified Streptomyces]MYT72161.1 RNA 2',3'-cyclic phosphodiesterase [Streptomyces sp. SID8367]RAJ81572.1 2'-5' RNA ligase [Streptomyces sp. PsTaAH-137]
MRLFAAVLPPAGVVEELGGVVDRLPGGDGVRWTGRGGWHLTLAFYGEVPDGTVEELSERLARAAGRTGAFTIGLHGGGQFGGRALWAGVRGDLAALGRLAERARAAGRKSGIEGEHRRYRPHLTLARARDPYDFGPYLTALGTFAGTPWTAGELTLVRSDLPRSGVPGEQPRYEKVGGWPLAAAR